LTSAHTHPTVPPTFGFPPELDGHWLEIGLAFLLPFLGGVALEGVVHARPGFMFFVGLFAGIGACSVVMIVTVLRAQKR
jgi:hypothetical protein